MSELVLDCETKKEFSEVGGRMFPERLGVSLLGVFTFHDNSLRAFREHELEHARELLLGASRVIGYNIKGFDWKVLAPYFPGVHLSKIPTLDLMESIAQFLGFRVKLDDVAQATLGIGKTGSGLDALRFFRAQQWQELEKYCLHDVTITKDVYEFGVKHGFVKTFTRNQGVVEVPVAWNRTEEPRAVNATLF